MGNLNITLEGYAHHVVENMIKVGFVKTKTEALRLALFEFDQRHHVVEEDVFAKMAKRTLSDIKKGKEKVTAFSMSELK